jgi:glycosyltransferase involved in cell wall biosynthesis
MGQPSLTSTTDPTTGPGRAASEVRVRYLHGRPGAHPLHRGFAEAVGGDFEFIDLKMRWQDRERSKLYVVSSWLVNAAMLPRRRRYDVFLIDNLHIGPVLMKRLFLRRNQKIVVHLGSHTMYFLLSHRFSRPVERLHLWALRHYDALLCEGRMTVDIAHELLGDKHPPIYEVFSGPGLERLQALMEVEPDLESRRILFVGGGPAEFRMHYKGLDLMIDAFSIAAESDPRIEFDIIGEWDDETVNALLARTPPAVHPRIHFCGGIGGVAEYAECLRRAALYLHCARGDAFPGATIEAMNAGLVPLVSEWTGTRQIVGQVSDRLIAPLDAAEIAERISWYFGLDADDRGELSRRSRIAAAPYNQQAATAHYTATFDKICEDLGLVRAG